MAQNPPHRHDIATKKLLRLPPDRYVPPRNFYLDQDKITQRLRSEGKTMKQGLRDSCCTHCWGFHGRGQGMNLGCTRTCSTCHVSDHTGLRCPHVYCTIRQWLRFYNSFPPHYVQVKPTETEARILEQLGYLEIDRRRGMLIWKKEGPEVRVPAMDAPGSNRPLAARITRDVASLKDDREDNGPDDGSGADGRTALQGDNSYKRTNFDGAGYSGAKKDSNTGTGDLSSAMPEFPVTRPSRLYNVPKQPSNTGSNRWHPYGRQTPPQSLPPVAATDEEAAKRARRKNAKDWMKYSLSLGLSMEQSVELAVSALEAPLQTATSRPSASTSTLSRDAMVAAAESSAVNRLRPTDEDARDNEDLEEGEIEEQEVGALPCDEASE